MISTNEMVESNLPLVRWVIGRMNMSATTMFDHDDIYQEGVLGLMEAARGFNPDRGFTFATYAQRIIWGRVIDASRRVHGRQGSALREGLATTTSMDKTIIGVEDDRTLVDIIPSTNDTEAEAIAHLDAEQHLDGLLLRYSDWERLTLRAEGLTLREIGERTGVTGSAILQTLQRIERYVEAVCGPAS